MNRRRWLLLASLLTWLVVPASLPAQTGFRYVHPTDPTCGGQSPCYTTIQAAVNAATAGEHVVLRAGTYQEQIAITGKNNTANATEADRIVIEADPTAEVGSVVLQGSVTQCTNGYAIRLQQSKFITIRGLTITGAGGQAVSLLGGNNQNQAIHLERLRIFGNGSSSCDGGITIARGNPGTLILNSLIYANGRNGVSTVDADGGPHYLIGNTIHGNQWSGVSVTRAHEIYLVNNAITGNGTAAGSTGGRFGVSRESSTSPQPAGRVFGDRQIQFDANGNVTSIIEGGALVMLTWDARDRLAAVEGPGGTTRYQYDALDRRVSASVQGTPTARLHDGGHMVGMGAAGFLRTLNVDEVAGADLAEGRRYALASHLGSTLALTDSSGAIVTEFSYEPFGRLAVIGQPSTYPFRYTGRDADETGYYYYRSRYYHPGLGRFLSEDPAGLQGGVNAYAYALGNPLSLSDPLGLWPPEIHHKLIDDAFPWLSEGERNALKLGSDITDLDQTSAGAPKHAMRSPKESVENAQRDMNKYIAGKTREAKDLDRGCAEGGQGAGGFSGRPELLHTLAMRSLGQALHPIMDQTSPSHKGFQRWGKTEIIAGGLEHVGGPPTAHALGEASITPAQKQETIRLLREHYEKFRTAGGCAR